MQAYYPSPRSSGGLLAMIALLIVALVGVIVYFMVFDKKGLDNILIEGNTYLVDKTTYRFTNGTFEKDLKITASGNTYTFTTTEDVAYNFDLKTPPKSYEIKTITNDIFFIKDSEKDEYVQYKGTTFSMVSAKSAFESNENMVLSTFTINTLDAAPSYDEMFVMGPTGSIRTGAVKESMTGTLEQCKAKCGSDATCIGFNYNANDSSCELKTLGTFEKGLSGYVPSADAQYYYKDGTLGSSNTYIGEVTGFAAPTDGWNTGMTFDACIQEAKSVSSTGVVGVGYDTNGKKCYFTKGDFTGDVVFTPDPDNNKMMMCLGTGDLGLGCKQ